jgi:hypothetical protein
MPERLAEDLRRPVEGGGFSSQGRRFISVKNTLPLLTIEKSLMSPKIPAPGLGRDLLVEIAFTLTKYAFVV